VVPESLTRANWDLGGEPSAWAYLHAGELFATTEIPPWRRRTELDRAELASVATFPVRAGMTLDEYVAAGPVSGMVVVLGGRIVFERYPRMQPGDRHLLMSVTKAFTSAVTGILERRGREIWSAAGFEAPAQLCTSASGAPASHGGLSMTLRDLARFGMLFTPSGRLIADAPVIAAADLRRIRPRRDLSCPEADMTPEATAAYGRVLPPPGRQWNFVTDEGDLFKGLRRARAVRLARPGSRRRVRRDAGRGRFGQLAAMVQPEPGAEPGLGPGRAQPRGRPGAGRK
jgi:CubicO group peptidase (beta-lactamase class C family)